MYLLRVNMTTGEVSREEVPAHLRGLGGRGLSARILLDEVRPTCDPLGPENKLILAPGLLGGAQASSVHRLSVGGKSPLTGGIKESNGGGIPAMRLGRLGVKAIIVEGKPSGSDFYVLKVDPEGARLLPASDLLGLRLGEAARRLYAEHGKKVGLIMIGAVGEKLLGSAGVVCNDMDGRPNRYCARGGVGALMASKGLKAVVIDDGGAPARAPARPEAFKEAVKAYQQLLLETPQTAELYPKYGTAGMVDTTNLLGGLPTRNFTTGTFEGAGKINGEALYQLIMGRGGEGRPTHACMPGCLIRCSNVFPDANGREVVAPVEYETIGLVGSNLGIDNLDVIARINAECNELGLDTIEVGAAIGVAMQGGLLLFGDGAGALKLIAEITEGSVLGRMIGGGAALTGKVLGVPAPVCKGQAMAAYEPRAIKGLGVTYATSPMGADHTAGTTARQDLKHHEAAGQAKASKNVQVTATIYDTLGMCIFSGTAVKDKIHVLADLVSAFTGETVTADDVRALGRQVWNWEREFNRRAGFTREHDRLPEHFYREVNPASGTVFDVPEEEIAGIDDL